MKLQKVPSQQQRPLLITKSETPAPSQFRPLKESWHIDAKEFSSTQDLVSASGELDGKSATYRFTTSADGAPFSQSERVRNAIGAGLNGALAGAVAGTMVGGALTLVVGLGDLLSVMMMGNPSGASSALITVPLALGAAVGLSVGTVAGWKADAQAPLHEVSGTLKREHAADGSSALAFYPQGELKNRVNLSDFQNAPEAPFSEPVVGQGKGFAKVQGALIGAVAPVATLVPIVGLLAGTVAGAKAGAALDQRTMLGQGLGAALGTGFTVASGASLAMALNGGSCLPLVGLALLGATTGALVGDKVLKPDSKSQPQFGNSWWMPYQSRETNNS